MKVGFLIIGRLKSTRLPKKILLDIKGKPILSHMIERLKLSKKKDTIVLCTSTNPQDDPLEELANQSNIECFRGDEDDVLKRMSDASVKFDLDYILEVTADCPLADPFYADEIVHAYENTDADLIRALDLPLGAFIYGIKPSALQKVIEIKNSSDTEVWGRYFTDTGLFNVYDMPVENPKHKKPNLRMTLDYPEDYEFFKKVFDALWKDDGYFSLDEVIDYLEANPDVVNINSDCQNKYLKRWSKQAVIALKKISSRKIIVLGCS